ncbi:MAG: thiamine pyrophosphate-binding protein [Actinomycetota bacterium]
MRVTEFLVDTIRHAGVEVVFGVPGLHSLPMVAALERSGLRFIGFRQEQAAAHAADGYGRATGRPGVVFLSAGPGTMNALTALAEATASSSPVLAISATLSTRDLGRGRGALHELSDPAPAYAAVTRFCDRATRIDEIPTLALKAIAATTAGRPGPSLIEVPADYFDAEVDGDAATLPPLPLEADRDAVNEAAFLLGLAARPLIWAGGGVHRAFASAELTRVAELLGAPVITTFMGKGAIPESHGLALGTLVGWPEAAGVLRGADLLLAVGTRFTAMSTGGWRLELPEQTIHIDIDPAEIGRNYPVRLGIAAHARPALAALADSLEVRGQGGTPRRRWIDPSAVREGIVKRAREAGEKEMARLDAVRRGLPTEVPIVHDMTVPSAWAWSFLPAGVPGTVHSPYGFGTLGFALPAALGVAASGGGPVVAFCGDAGLVAHVRELATAVEHGLPVIVLVFNDRARGALKTLSSARYGTTFALDLAGPDFLALAGAFGVPARRAAEPGELERALAESVAAGGPQLVEVPGEWAPLPLEDPYR